MYEGLEFEMWYDRTADVLDDAELLFARHLIMY